jgi:hypothetical protein
MICAEHCRKGERICSSSEELNTLFEARAVRASSGSGHRCLFQDELGLVPGFRFGFRFPRTTQAAKYFEESLGFAR